MTDMVKDADLMPPPSNTNKQEYMMHCENSQSTMNTTGITEYFKSLYRFLYKISISV